MKAFIRLLSVFVVFIAIVVGYGVYHFFFDLNNLPHGELINEVPSPNGEYTFKAYLVNGGATVDFAVRGEVQFNKSSKKPKTIYWNYHESEANIKWLDNDTVVINGHELNVTKETFDFRRH